MCACEPFPCCFITAFLDIWQIGDCWAKKKIRSPGGWGCGFGNSLVVSDGLADSNKQKWFPVFAKMVNLFLGLGKVKSSRDERKSFSDELKS